ncbi:MAG: cytochrome c oxidase assembly protein [Bacteriovoracaceae bacterium]
MNSAFAHGTEEHLTAATVSWTWDPSMIFFVILAVVYLAALMGKQRMLLRSSRKSAFFIGTFILLFAYLPPVDTLADRFFSAHMVQHLLITVVGVPLIIFGKPLLVLTHASRKMRPAIKKFSSFLPHVQKPILCVLLYQAVFWFWHVPYFYDLALLNQGYHLLEHACMAAAAFLFWPLIIDSFPASPLKRPMRMVVLFFMMTLDTALSAALTFSERNWYAYDSLSVADQQLGGVIMWAVGGTVWLIALLLNCVVWMKEENFSSANFPLSSESAS